MAFSSVLLACRASGEPQCLRYPGEMAALVSPFVGLNAKRIDQSEFQTATAISTCLKNRYSRLHSSELTLVAVKIDTRGRSYFEYQIEGESDTFVIVVVDARGAKTEVYRYTSVSGPPI